MGLAGSLDCTLGREDVAFESQSHPNWMHWERGNPQRKAGVTLPTAWRRTLCSEAGGYELGPLVMAGELQSRIQTKSVTQSPRGPPFMSTGWPSTSGSCHFSVQTFGFLLSGPRDAGTAWEGFMP